MIQFLRMKLTSLLQMRIMGRKEELVDLKVDLEIACLNKVNSQQANFQTPTKTTIISPTKTEVPPQPKAATPPLTDQCKLPVAQPLDT